MPAGRYYLDGKRVPGCTTSIVGQLGWNTQALKWWAFRVGKEGNFESLNDYTKPADIGTFAHAAVEADLKDEPIDLSGVPEEMRRTVEKIVVRWQRWKKSRVAEVLLAEEELVSKELRFGGRPDLVFRDPDGEVWLLDLKTGGIYAEHLVQVAAYAMLVEEAKGIKIDTLAVLRIQRDTDGITTLERPWSRESPEARTVILARELYDLHKRLKAEV